MGNSCVILAGGRGTRLAEVVSTVPKCLAPVSDSTFLEVQMNHLYRAGVSSFLLSLGYLAEIVIHHIESKRFPFEVNYIVEEQPLQTGGAIALAFQEFGLSESLVVNGDTIITGDLTPMMVPLTQGTMCKVGLCFSDDRARYGSVDFNSQKQIISFNEKNADTEGFINAGIYRVRKEVLPEQLIKPFSFERELLPALVQRRVITCELLSGEFIDIGVPSEYSRFCNELDRFVE